jgi:hypothetical protein
MDWESGGNEHQQMQQENFFHRGIFHRSAVRFTDA